MPDIAKIKVSIFPRVSVSVSETQSSFKDEVSKAHLHITFIGDALENCLQKSKYYSMFVHITLRDTKNNLSLGMKEYAYDIHNIDKTGQRVFTTDIESQENIIELISETITIDCEVMFIPLSCT